MQYGVEVESYKRLRKEDGMNYIGEVTSPVKFIIEVLTAFLISRVVITLDITSIDNIAPFGIAFTMAILLEREKKESLLVFMGSLIGYISIFNRNSEDPLYISILSLMLILKLMPIKQFKNNITVFINFFIIAMTMIFYRYFVNHFSMDSVIFISIIQTVLIYPIYYIIRFAIRCFEDINTNHYFISEEIIAMTLILCLVLSGIGDINVYGISIKNILAIIFLFIVSYSLGGTIGATAGVIMGVVIGISSNNMLQLVSVYGLCAFVVGIFKDTGKLFASIAGVIIYVVLNVYAKTFDIKTLIEITTSIIVFAIIPKNFLKNITAELDNDVKEDKFNIFHFNKLKEEFSGRLNDFTEVISSMSVILNGLSDNEKLLLQSKGTALIENLGDRVCSNCDMRNMCWRREFHSTYTEFSQLIQNYEEGNKEFPLALEKKCLKKYNLIKNAEELVENHILNEVWRKRLSEGRKILASQINNMAVTVGELVDDFNKDISICSDVERSVFKALNRFNIKYDDVLCYNDKNGRLNIKVIIDECGGEHKCVKNILPIINNAIGANMSIGGDGCVIDPTSKKCTILIEETPKFYVSSYSAVACKDGESCTGDSFSFGKTSGGNYSIIVSDGMGSGQEAGEESKSIVELMEKFIKAGFSNLTAINAVNSVMTMKFSEDEKFATLDMQNIDLYTGETNFIKIGAVESFIKKAKGVQTISSKTLPFGILDNPDADIIEKKVSNGDMIITISDGILDVGTEKSNFRWLEAFLEQSKIKSPKELAIEILEQAKELNGGKVKDDMTVVVSKVYAI